MNIEQQVLNLEQVRELQELGFDVEKYASMCWFEQTPFAPIEQPKKYELEILTYSLMGNRGYLEVIPTLTIGDILEILPYELGSDELFSLEKQNIYFHIYYLNWEGAYIFNITNKSLIKALFETLKWCIKQKHI